MRILEQEHMQLLLKDQILQQEQLQLLLFPAFLPGMSS